MKKKIVVFCPEFKSEHKEIINKTAAKYGYDVHYYDTVESAAPDAADAEILYGQTVPFIHAGKEARWICAMSAGVDNYLKPGVIQNPDCILTNSSGAYGLSISEHLVMVTLMLLRRQPVFMKEMEQQIWTQTGRQMRSIRDSVITIAGTGDIGTSYAKRLKPFGPKEVIGINRSGRGRGNVYDVIDTQEHLKQYLPKTDVLVLCLPETADTHGFLSRDRISLLSENAYVINVGRGSAIDQEALVEALNQERIAGAALDVMQEEPVPAGDPLWRAKNCILTPHISGKMTLPYTVNKNMEMFLTDLVNYCEDRPLRYIVNRGTGY